ncbi:pentapeptide repeat-containing protein, partial [Crocosphaera sp. Alani8]|uniref:pentapeptide repeat-containing protein n=1 Tax=Crocosphaera sp. Alani8 TaxID=3038952 RepID=UPI00313F2148
MNSNNPFDQRLNRPNRDMSLLIEGIKNEQDIDKRSHYIRKLDEYYGLQALPFFLEMKQNIDQEDEFIKYEIELSLQKAIKNPYLNVDFILENLVTEDNYKAFERLQQSPDIPRILIDSNLLEEFLLREKTTRFDDANQVIEYILSGKIHSCIGVKGVRYIWSSMREHRGQPFANKMVLELLNKFTICRIDQNDIQLNKYPTLSIPTVTQIAIARKYNLDGIITLRYKDFIGSDYSYIYSPQMFAKAIEDPSLSLLSITEKLTKLYHSDTIEQKRQELDRKLEGKSQSIYDLWNKGTLPLFNGWRIEKFDILSSSNNLTSATVILGDEQDKERYKASAFKTGSINALFTAFDDALENIIEKKKHQFEEIYVANITGGREGKVTVQAVVKTGNSKIVKIHSHENIIKAYFFAYIKAIIAIYAPDEYESEVHSQEELTTLHQIGRRDFHQLNFTKLDFSDCDADLGDSNLTECNFSEANLSGANLINTNLEGANFSYADLTKVQLDTNNLTLFKATTLSNTKFPEICFPASDESRIDIVSHLLKQANTEISQYKIFALHRMSTPTWWLTDLGEKFWQLNQQLLKRGIPIQRLFILPTDPQQKHLEILRMQKNAGVIVNFICQRNVKNTDQDDLRKTNLLVCENLSVKENSFATKMIFPEQQESEGYISFKQQDIKENKERFSKLWQYLLKKPGVTRCENLGQT